MRMRYLTLRRHWLTTIVLVPVTLFILLQTHWAILRTFYGYEIGTSPRMADRQLQRALDTNNPDFCGRIIVTTLAPGLARYDIVNGCYAGYATATGDISLCMDVAAPGLCVSAIAEKRNDPDLCEHAVDPRRSGTDRRGDCFGYFAAKEMDIKYCTRAMELRVPPARLDICNIHYVKATGDLDGCQTSTLYKPCYWAAFDIAGDNVCTKVLDEEHRKRCRESLSSNCYCKPLSAVGNGGWRSGTAASLVPQLGPGKAIPVVPPPPPPHGVS